MKKFVFISFFLIGLVDGIKACDCVVHELNDQMRKEAFEYFDLVFLGEVIDRKLDGRFTFRIIEIFKGDRNLTEIEGELFSSCSFTPNEGEGRWIVYGNMIDGKIDLSQCGLTRSYENPHRIMSSTYPPPPLKANELEYKNHVKRIREQARNDWQEELTMLRMQRN